MPDDKKILDIIANLSLKEKNDLILGVTPWSTKDLNTFNLKGLFMTDGPHGLRELEATKKNFGSYVKATCFPSAALMACSFNKDLLYLVGDSIGKEARHRHIDIVLGPGVNIKRNPLCGRNFEYYSEDPLLTGKLVASYIKGMQSNNVGACIKHFAVNNQETNRYIVNSVVDKRTLHDLYLKPFEIAIKEANPECLMTSYNKVNGFHVAESQYLLSSYLRKHLEYNGLVMTDWCAMVDKVASIAAGLDLEMPYVKRSPNVLKTAILDGRLSVSQLNEACYHIIQEMLYHQEKHDDIDSSIYDKNYLVAKQVAEQSIVLAKNEGNILPLNRKENVAFIGPFVSTPRYEGAGSGNINAYRTKTIFDCLVEGRFSFSFAEGCSGLSSEIDELLLNDAIYKAKKADKVVLFIGTQPSVDSEGFDRTDLELPMNQVKLIENVLNVNRNVSLVIFSGGVVKIPYLNDVKGILIGYLAGEAYAEAILSVLYGEVNPSGHLAETWVKDIHYSPSYMYFPGRNNSSEYREGMNVGYRYFKKAPNKVNFPFGHGLSYTSFEYSDFLFQSSRKNKLDIIVSFNIKNTELKDFDSISLNPGEMKTISFVLNRESFEHYYLSRGRNMISNGTYVVYIGNSSEDIVYSNEITIDSEKSISDEDYLSFANLSEDAFLQISDKDFEKMIGQSVNYIPAYIGPFTFESTFEDIQHTFIGKLLTKIYKKVLKKTQKEDSNVALMMEKSFLSTPIRLISMYGISFRRIDGIVLMTNGHYIKGLFKLIF